MHAAKSLRDGSQLAIKLIDVATVDQSLALARLQVRDQVARIDDRVVPIVALANAKVNKVDGFLTVASPYIHGRSPDITIRSDVERMGRALARLHQSLRLVHQELGLVPALAAAWPVEGLAENHQLLHGDFGPANQLIDNDGRVWIIDFGDCGYGPVEFELGNTLFMALFATSASLNQPSDEYRTFRRWFLGAYQASAELAVSDHLIDIGLQARSDALRYWLNHLDEAPIGIRFATDEWRNHLCAFAGVIDP